jgi:hypothetical protein
MLKNGRRRLVMAREVDGVDGVEGEAEEADVVEEKQRSMMTRGMCSQMFELGNEVTRRFLDACRPKLRLT